MVPGLQETERHLAGQPQVWACQNQRRGADLAAVKTVHQDLLNEATRRLVAEFQPVQVWLFGSHAWGTPTEDSDVDLLVIVKDTDEPPIQRAQRAHRCLRGLRLPKDVLVETRQEVDRVRQLRASLGYASLSRGRRLS